MSHVVANGLRFHVQRVGAGEGSVVVMVHGLLIGSLASWYFTVAPALAARHRVLLYDLRGHGRSDPAPDGYDVASMARDLAALTADVDEPLTLVGHSYGALVALRFAIDHPERVARLVVIEAPLPPSELVELRGFLRLSPAQMAGALPEPVRAFVDSGGRQARRLVRTLHRLVAETSLIADLEAEPDIDDVELARIACPTLCVYGSESSCAAVGRRLSATVPDARLEMLPGGHYLHVDAADALTRHIAEFLDG